MGASYGEKEEPSRGFSHFASNKSPVWFLLLCCNQAGRGSHVSSSIPKVSCTLHYYFPTFFILVCAQGDLEEKIFGDLDFWLAWKYQLLLLGGDPMPGACSYLSLSQGGLVQVPGTHYGETSASGAPPDIPALLPARTIAEVCFFFNFLFISSCFLYSVT